MQDNQKKRSITAIETNSSALPRLQRCVGLAHVASMCVVSVVSCCVVSCVVLCRVLCVVCNQGAGGRRFVGGGVRGPPARHGDVCRHRECDRRSGPVTTLTRLHSYSLTRVPQEALLQLHNEESINKVRSRIKVESHHPTQQRDRLLGLVLMMVSILISTRRKIKVEPRQVMGTRSKARRAIASLSLSLSLSL
jgi:hypothetical protein